MFSSPEHSIDVIHLPQTRLQSASPGQESAATSALGVYWRTIKRASIAWIDDDAPSMGAALAFYSAFSIAPLLIIVIAIAGSIFGIDSARDAVLSKSAEFLGPVGTDAIGRLLEAAAIQGSGLVPTLISVALVLVGATTVLIELQADLDRIWDAPPRPGGVAGFLRTRVCTLGLVVAVGLLLIVSLVAAGAVAALAQSFRTTVLGAQLLHALDFLISIAVSTGLFAMLFKWLPHVKLRWRDLWIGALITSVLFNIGRLGIALYLGRSATGSAYAAAGSLAVLLLWLYYSAQIFLFGAELAWAQATFRGGDGARIDRRRIESYEKIRSRPIAGNDASADIRWAGAGASAFFQPQIQEGFAMERSTTLGGNSPSNPTASVDSTARAAHQAVDDVSSKTTAQVNQLSGSAHRAVDRAADAAGSALEQAKQVQARVTDAACESIRARPIISVAGALVAGYLLGRLARL